MFYIVQKYTSQGVKLKILESPDDKEIQIIVEKLLANSIVAKTTTIEVLSKGKNLIKKISEEWLTPIDLLADSYYWRDPSKELNLEIDVDQVLFQRPKGTLTKRKIKKVDLDYDDVEALFKHWREDYNVDQKLTPVKKLKYKAYLDILDRLEALDYKNIITIYNIIT